MRIYSWNVNGIRAAVRKGFVDWLEGCDGDIVALQEVRALREQVPDELLDADGWHHEYQPAERKGYSGVGLITRSPAESIATTLGSDEHDAEGRLQIARFGKLTIANGYFPNGNGKNRDNSRIPFKLDFYARLFDRLQPLVDAGEPVLVMGDLNTAHEEIDLARPKENVNTSGFRPEERQELTRWIDSGWVDTFRHFEADGGHYSWWSQRGGARARNVGWRIDYILASPAAMPYVRAASIHPEVLGSDHCPISVDIDPGLLR